MSTMNSRPYPGESPRMAEMVSTPHLIGAQKVVDGDRMEAMQKGQIKSNQCFDATPPFTLIKRGFGGQKDSARCLHVCEDKKDNNEDSFITFSDIDPWPTNKLGTDTVDRCPDLSPLEGKALFKPDICIYDLPWSKVSNTILGAYHSHIEAWYMDPVEIVAHRYEWRGFFEEASKLRIKFKELNILHGWVLQWYLWAKKQQASKDSPKGKTIATCIGSWDQPRALSPQYSEWKTDINWKDPGYIDELFHEKEPLSETFDNTLDKVSLSASRATYNQKGRGNRNISDIYSTIPTEIPTHQSCTNDFRAANIEDLPLRPCVLDTERIIPQIMKDRVFRGHYQGDLQSPKGTYMDSDSITYRNHARWILESNIMSDDSGDEYVMGSPAATHPVPKKPQRGTLGGCWGLAHTVECTPTEKYWDDPLFLGDSESSDCLSSDVSASSEDVEFPIISGEELQKILEEAKGTVQFHKWQNAPAHMHQKEFKTLINLHRFAMGSEAKSQERWRSREKTEKSGDTNATAAQNTTSSSRPPNPKQLSGNIPMKPKPRTVAPNGKPPAPFDHLKARRQLDIKESEYSYITPDDIKFLRNLRRKFTEGEFIQQTQAKIYPLPVQTALEKKPNKGQESGSLRNVLLNTKLFPSVNYRIDHGYRSWFSESNREQAASGPEQHNDGAVPKRHHMTAPFGDVSFHPETAEHHPFSEAVKSPFFKKLVISTGKFWNPGANISLSGFWVTESLFITALNFHPWAPSTAAQSLQDQIEDFESRNSRIDIFVSNNYLSWFSPNNDPEAIKVILRAWDTSARIAIFEPEDKTRVTKHFVGIDALIEADKAYDYNGVHIATVGYNPSDAARGDPLGLRLLIPSHRSVTFGDITISKGRRESTVQLPTARLDSGFSHGSYGRMCVVMEEAKSSGSVIGIVSGQYEEHSLHRPKAPSDSVSTFPGGFKAELRRLLQSGEY